MSDARSRRYRQNALTLVGALFASLVVVFAIVLVTVRPDVSLRDSVDWRAVHAATPNPEFLVNPDFTAADGDWWSNRAEYTSGANPEWYIGFVTPTETFVSVRQFTESVSSDIAEKLDDAPAETTQIAGAQWQVIDRSMRDNPGNDRLIYVVGLPAGGSLIVSGTAEPDLIELVAERAFLSVRG